MYVISISWSSFMHEFGFCEFFIYWRLLRHVWIIMRAFRKFMVARIHKDQVVESKLASRHCLSWKIIFYRFLLGHAFYVTQEGRGWVSVLILSNFVKFYHNLCYNKFYQFFFLRKIWQILDEIWQNLMKCFKI